MNNNKFGELIKTNTVIIFDDKYTTDIDRSLISTEVAKVDVRTILIDRNNNKELVEALNIKEYPTLVYYKGGEAVLRGPISSIHMIKEFIDTIIMIETFSSLPSTDSSA